MNRNKSENAEKDDMRKTYWALILSGAAGGALIVSSIVSFALVDYPLNIASFLLVVLGLAVMWYARYAEGKQPLAVKYIRGIK